MAREFVCSYTTPIVKTTAGKIRGYRIDSTYTFHGIKYANAKRFQMPTPPEPWEGVRDALSYGYVSPMLNRETAVGEIMVPHRYWPKDENCQYLNVWTQSLDPHAKKPVLVWFHGGGFSDGSSIEQVAYDGENLSKFGDVVVVSVNHRLNILGYLDLSPYGVEKYWNSANVGNADLVASLQWIHDNIANFGGDPENVTIFGQSGGGAKVTSLMQTPSADGLFHKGIVMSGIADRIMSFDNTDSRPLVDAILEELGITAPDIEKLETVPYETLAEAYKKVVPAIQAVGGYTGCAPIPNRFYIGDPRIVGFTEHAKTIPVIAGTVVAELGGFAPTLRNRTSMSAEEQIIYLKKYLGNSAEELAALFHSCYPDRPVTDLLLLDTFSRTATKDFVRKKAAFSQSATYNYVFSFVFPMDDGKPAWHCSDLPFFFHNTDKVFICNVPDVSDQLEAQMSGILISFARTGIPSAEGLPEWTACTPDNISTMILDRECRIVHNFDDKLYEIYTPLAPDPHSLHADEEVTVLH